MGLSFIDQSTNVRAEVAKGHGCHPLHGVIFRPNQRHEDVQRPLLEDRISMLQVRRKVSERPGGFPRNQWRRGPKRLSVGAAQPVQRFVKVTVD